MKKFEKATEPKELDFYAIELDSNGEKQIHISGYTYYGDQWEYADVCWCIIPLAEFIKNVAEDEDYPTTMMGECKQYIEDCEDDKLTEIINEYFDGHPADYHLPYGSITLDTPCGNYVC